AVGDVEADFAVERDRLGHIAHGQRHRADVLDRPGRHAPWSHDRLCPVHIVSGRIGAMIGRPAHRADRAAPVPIAISRINERRARMRHVKWAVVAGLAALAVVAVGALQAQQLSGPYKTRVLEPLTGNLAAEGKRHLEGFEIVRDLINERGGVMGKKLTFVVGDAVDPTVAASEATRLATREGVKIITGTFSSTLCGAASEAASRQNVIYWET